MLYTPCILCLKFQILHLLIDLKLSKLVCKKWITASFTAAVILDWSVFSPCSESWSICNAKFLFLAKSPHRQKYCLFDGKSLITCVMHNKQLAKLMTRLWCCISGRVRCVKRGDTAQTAGFTDKLHRWLHSRCAITKVNQFVNELVSAAWRILQVWVQWIEVLNCYQFSK